MDVTFSRIEANGNAATIFDPVLRRGCGRPAGSLGAAGLRRDLLFHVHARVLEAARVESYYPVSVTASERKRFQFTY